MRYDIVNTSGQVVRQFQDLLMAMDYATRFGQYTRIWDSVTRSWVRTRRSLVSSDAA